MTLTLDDKALAAYNTYRKASQALAQSTEGPEREAKQAVLVAAALDLASWVDVVGAMYEVKERMGDDFMKS